MLCYHLIDLSGTVGYVHSLMSGDDSYAEPSMDELDNSGLNDYRLKAAAWACD
jgi:hypothetical protein